MSSVIIAGNTSGTITVAAPAAAGTNTITMPAATGTMALTSDITTEIPSQSGNSGKFLTTNGSAASWGVVASGGLDLISTIATSGATEYNTGVISFTGYKLVQIWTDLVTHDGSGGNQRLQMTTNGGSASQLGNGDIPAVDTIMSQTTFDLSNGSFLSMMRVNPTINGLPASFTGGARNPGFTTSTTSIAFDWSIASTFDGGTIRIYGLK